LLGGQKLDAITNARVQQLKVHLEDKAAKTVNNVLTVLNVMLKTAADWQLNREASLFDSLASRCAS
jgi:hypothetical protein